MNFFRPLHTTETTNQAAWIAYDHAFFTSGGNFTAAEAARAEVLRGDLVEGPAEHPVSFSARSTARAFGVLS